MGSELVPGLVAVGGGSALAGAIVMHERRRERSMRQSRKAVAVTFPVRTGADAALAALGSLSGLESGLEVVAQLEADQDGIRHLLHVPATALRSVNDQVGAAIPGARLQPARRHGGDAPARAVRLAAPVGALLRTDDAVASSQALLSGLGTLREGERVSLRWALRAAPAPALPDESKVVSLQAKAELSARRKRLADPGFTVAGLVLVWAGEERARELAGHVISVLRSRRGVGSGLIVRGGRVRSGAVMPTTSRCRGWLTAAELLPLLGWPLGELPAAGVELGAAREIPVPRHLPREGRRLLVGRDGGGERPVALTAEAAKQHLLVVGPTGTGKSVLLARSILDDIDAGYGGVLIDPKADLVDAVLDRAPARHARRVVMLDPAQSGPVPGLNLLGVGDPELRSDVVLGALKRIYADSWGVRSDTYLRLGLRTLAEIPGAVLTDWPRLFADAAFRQQAINRASDPMLVAAWQSYAALSPAQQQEHIAAPLGKVMGLLSRPSVRGVLAQSDPKLDIGRLLEERRWLLVSLSPGRLGEPAADLLGAILTYAFWSAIEGRAELAPERRRPVFAYFDELQSLSALPFGIEYLFERARGLGCGVTVATQALARLPESVRASILGNVASLVSFRAGFDESSRISRELPGLSAQDIQSLGRFEVAARIATTTGRGSAVVTGTTRPLPKPTGQAAAIRRRSAERYGGNPTVPQQEQQPGASGDGVGRTRRRS